jgi:hypothetical protein
MKNKVKKLNSPFQLVNNKIILGAFIALLLGALFYILSLLDSIKSNDIVFSEFLRGSGIIIMSMSIVVIILTLVYEKFIVKLNVINDVKTDSNIVTTICPKCKNKFSATPEKIDDSIVIQCSHCGVKLKRINNKDNN